MSRKIQSIRERYRYPLVLLKQLVKTDFKLRYQGSMLGYLWSLLRPLFMFIVLYLVFTVFLPLGNNIPNKAVYILLGIVLWNFFVEVTTGSVNAIVGKSELLRKINFPKYIIIIAVAVSALINLALNFIVVGVFVLISHMQLTWSALLIIPVLLELLVISLGMAFILSAAFVKFRDVSYIWDVMMQAGFYATPILYWLPDIAQRYHGVSKLMLLNPLAQIIQDARYFFVSKQTMTVGTAFPGRTWIYILPVGVSVLIFCIGALYFRSRSKYFAEEV